MRVSRNATLIRDAIVKIEEFARLVQEDSAKLPYIRVQAIPTKYECDECGKTVEVVVIYKIESKHVERWVCERCATLHEGVEGARRAAPLIAATLTVAVDYADAHRSVVKDPVLNVWTCHCIDCVPSVSIQLAAAWLGVEIAPSVQVVIAATPWDGEGQVGQERLIQRLDAAHA